MRCTLFHSHKTQDTCPAKLLCRYYARMDLLSCCSKTVKRLMSEGDLFCIHHLWRNLLQWGYWLQLGSLHNSAKGPDIKFIETHTKAIPCRIDFGCAWAFECSVKCPGIFQQWEILDFNGHEPSSSSGKCPLVGVFLSLEEIFFPVLTWLCCTIAAHSWVLPYWRLIWGQAQPLS